jgi:hypothetical protein
MRLTYLIAPEARSLKGLVLSAMGQKEQALEDAKLGLRNDLQSHVCMS